MKKLLGLAVASALSAAALPAVAADYPIKAPPPPPIWTWTGFYVGLNAGYGWGSNDARLGPSSDAFSTAFWTPAFAAGAAPSVFGLEPSGFIGGGQIGYNWQAGAWVFGVEADIQWADIKDTVAINTAVIGFVPGFFSSSQGVDFIGTVRVRTGFATDRVFWYVTGGLAYGNVNYNLNFAFPASLDFHTISTSRTSVGWTLGGGFEWAFAHNWSAKLEYLHIDLGDESFRSTPGGRPANLATTLNQTFENRYNIVRFGLNYKFGCAPGAC